MEEMMTYLVDSNDRGVLQIGPLTLESEVPQPRNILISVAVITLNVQGDGMHVVNVHTFDGVFGDFGLLACVGGWNDGDGCCWREIRGHGKVDIVSIDKPPTSVNGVSTRESYWRDTL
jgi:hypothetical protein